jgi:hypothetical protein
LARRTYTIVVGQRTVAVVTEWLSPGRLVAMARARGDADAASTTSVPHPTGWVEEPTGHVT